MNLNQLDTRIATREAGTTARGATRPWGFGEIARGGVLEFQMSQQAGAWGQGRLPGGAA